MSAPERGDPSAPMQYIENKTFDEIVVGDSASLTRTLKPLDIELFAVMSGDVNPAHVDAEYAKTDMFHGVIAHGMWGGALISAVLGTELPGPGTIFLNQALTFMAPVGLDDKITARVAVTEKQDNGRLLLACTCLNQHGRVVIEGVARVIAPREKVRRPRVVLPEVHLHTRGAQYPGELPAGDYEMIVEEERIQGVSFEAFRRTATYLMVKGDAGVTEMRLTSERDLAMARFSNRSLISNQ